MNGEREGDEGGGDGFKCRWMENNLGDRRRRGFDSCLSDMVELKRDGLSETGNR